MRPLFWPDPRPPSPAGLHFLKEIEANGPAAAKKNMRPLGPGPGLRKKHAASWPRPGLRKKHAASFLAGRGARKRPHVFSAKIMRPLM